MPANTATQYALLAGWRPIPGIPRYEVSDEGEVRHYLRQQPLKLQETYKGYLAFYYYPAGTGKRRRRKCYIHRAVALAFLGPPPFEGCTVDHFPNRCRQCNEVWNLRWASVLEQAANKDVAGLTAEDFAVEEI